jgi:hypothetical protein
MQAMSLTPGAITFCDEVPFQCEAVDSFFPYTGVTAQTSEGPLPPTT